MQELKTVIEFRPLIGMNAYLGHNVMDLSILLAPMNNLFKYISALVLDNPQKITFALLRNIVTETPVLKNKRLQVRMRTALVNMLHGIRQSTIQRDTYISRTFSEAEKKHVHIEKECLMAV